MTENYFFGNLFSLSSLYVVDIETKKEVPKLFSIVNLCIVFFFFIVLFYGQLVLFSFLVVSLMS